MKLFLCADLRGSFPGFQIQFRCGSRLASKSATRTPSHFAKSFGGLEGVTPTEFAVRCKRRRLSEAHEAIGVVEAVGSEVRKVKTGGFVLMPFAFSDGTRSARRRSVDRHASLT